MKDYIPNIGLGVQQVFLLAVFRVNLALLIYEDERSNHLESITNATVLECQNMVKELQKKTKA